MSTDVNECISITSLHIALDNASVLCGLSGIWEVSTTYRLKLI